MDWSIRMRREGYGNIYLFDDILWSLFIYYDSEASVIPSLLSLCISNSMKELMTFFAKIRSATIISYQYSWVYFSNTSHDLSPKHQRTPNTISSIRDLPRSVSILYQYLVALIPIIFYKSFSTMENSIKLKFSTLLSGKQWVYFNHWLDEPTSANKSPIVNKTNSIIIQCAAHYANETQIKRKYKNKQNLQTDSRRQKPLPKV